jgi:ferredoxin
MDLAFNRMGMAEDTFLIHQDDLALVDDALRILEDTHEVYEEDSGDMDTAIATEPSTVVDEDGERIEYVNDCESLDSTWSYSNKNNDIYGYCYKHGRVFGHELGMCEACGVCTDGMSEAYRDYEEEEDESL